MNNPYGNPYGPPSGGNPYGYQPTPPPGHYPPPQQPGYFGQPAQMPTGPMGGYHLQPTAKPPMPIPVVIVVALVLLAALLASLTIPFFDGTAQFLTLPILAGFPIAAALAFRPGTVTRILVTVTAVFWACIGLGIVFAIPVLILLWMPTSSRDYFPAIDAWRRANTA